MYTVAFKITWMDRNSGKLYATARSKVTIPFIPFEHLHLKVSGVEESIRQPFWNGEYFEVNKVYEVCSYEFDRLISNYLLNAWDFTFEPR